MNEQPKQFDDEELRKAIRAEIEQRDREKQKAKLKKESQKAAGAIADRKRDIYREELRRYYENRPGYKEIINEDGETEWITKEEVSENGQLYDADIEDPSNAMKMQKAWVLVAIILFLGIAIGLYAVLHEGKGSIRVECNIPEATIIIDAVNTGYYADFVLEEVAAGKHLITVEKAGFKIEGDIIQRIDLKAGESMLVSFTLVPDVVQEQDETEAAVQAKEGAGQ
ncbi:hypothetical protein CEE37_11270 [candidate division LCP-89 bacterium B3_LCP]|uniref:PEGA domain-containing protein n=1 Tax=candidate division LCP-89 bacterium B3_LCP TaxID=2012998 RepID=A0A532UY23_UNCL8|nr:MAG: hypothetical protein CEE37_11270 [candidate division LCP-89 bacterium B3_LCP]